MTDATLLVDVALYKTLRRQQRRLLKSAARLGGQGFRSLSGVAKDLADEYGQDADVLLARIRQGVDA